MRKLIAGGLLAATIAGGSVAVATVSPVGFAGAQTEASPADAQGERPRPARVLDQTLDELVAEGTLTREQADAIRERLRAKVGELRTGDGPGQGRGPGHRPFGHLKEKLEPAAEALGMSAEELGRELRQGSSLNEIADAQGVDRGVVRQALIDQATTRIDQAVADGKLDAARAEELRAALPGRVDQLMDRHVRHPAGARWGAGADGSGQPGG